ncbi:PREDICTED: putative FBD-associated F-box protein At1g05080 [Camelina sativa]|uniref:FBD-associated F-box protein At1g05080 n=1 Tax=Camelina sativa TaxID=90675 RepID=A0ABM1QM94_CAMSA|nr:PREDICTED: putative FBD-associated F-box protein At1g05080 [Camelina sativa]
MLPRLDYQEKVDGPDHDKSIWWFLDKSLELHKAPVLEILLIKLGPGCPSDADVGKWVTKAVDRRLVELKFKLCWSTGPTRLPKSLYTCETLEELTLSHKILVDFPSSSCLPSLLTLKLFYVVYKDEASLVSFLAIDTPAVIDFFIVDFSRDSWSIENMPCLNEAYIDVWSFPDIDKSKTSISRVLSLELFMTTEELVRCSAINFSRLIKLSICPWKSDWLGPLLRLLENAPKLKDLLVNYEYAFHPVERIPLSWNQPRSIPRCMSSHLEIFEYREYGDRVEEEEFLTYILANSMCLKTATVSVRPGVLKKKELTIEKLSNIPRVSTTCQLLLK